MPNEGCEAMPVPRGPDVKDVYVNGSPVIGIKTKKDR